MSTITCSRFIEAPPADVFATMTDLEGAAERISAITRIEILSDRPFGVGTRWRETRMMFGRERTEEMWITDLEPGRSYSTEASSCGCIYRCTISVEPDGTGAILEMKMDASPTTMMAKLMSLACFFMTGTLVKCIEKDFDDIQASLEGPAADAVTA